ncbi:MAG TPA: YggS family pyridoxal phosphate-dependent enzyme [Longimicrobiales bacterium]|nr:YggS family pyridoxal phosphate-dependent enzyme [Longimicrobiales bacterium]
MDTEGYRARLRGALPEVRERIERARVRGGRASGVTLVAVTKGHPLEAALAVAAEGVWRCGENRVQELAEKVERAGLRAPDDTLEWHLIGHLQRNKARLALPLFSLIHSVDSLRLARALSEEAVRAGRTVEGLVQVNVSGEEAKGGIREGHVEAVGRICELEAVRVRGLMTMAPLTDDYAWVRRTFRRAREVFDECAAGVEGFEARYLSMGMSLDYELAVEEGSTMVRLGTVLLGERGR